MHRAYIDVKVKRKNRSHWSLSFPLNLGFAGEVGSGEPRARPFSFRPSPGLCTAGDLPLAQGPCLGVESAPPPPPPRF